MPHGIVIGTYDSLAPDQIRHGVPSVDLNLSVIRARCGDVPILVADDASPWQSQLALRAVCAKHGAEFVSNPYRLGHTSGDIAAFGRGLEWANRRGLTTLTKLSQRMIFDIPDWITLDSACLLESGFGTMTASLANYGDPSRIRTEAVMMVVARWSTPSVLERYRPQQYHLWNEAHTATTVRKFIDPQRPFPHFLPWPRVRAIRGLDAPPVYFRHMHNADGHFRELAGRQGVRWPQGLRMIDSIATSEYRS